MIITTITVLLFEVLLISGLVQFYFREIDIILDSSIQNLGIENSTQITNETLKKEAHIFIERLSQISRAQVQIIDSNGFLLADSVHPEWVGRKLVDSDISAALKGSRSSFRGRIPKTYESVFSVSYPLKNNNDVVGIIRLTTSLSQLNRTLAGHIGVLLVLGLIIIFAIFTTSIFISSTITKPVKDITVVAEKLAQGDFSVRVKKHHEDEVGKLADTLNYMAEEIDNLEKLKLNFIASISHELRTPLTSIKGWILTINQEDMEMGEMKDGLEIIEKESDRLSLLVEELLDFSKFTSGAVSLKKSTLDINKVLKHVIKQMTPRAKRQNVDLEHSLEEGSIIISGDENRLKQVFINILDNSFKFTSEKGCISICSKGSDDGIFISIKDNGCGIDKEDLPKVTHKFYKGSNNYSGSGIGLSVCEEIINLHGGRLRIDSKAGEGTLVEIYLPLT